MDQNHFLQTDKKYNKKWQTGTEIYNIAQPQME